MQATFSRRALVGGLLVGGGAAAAGLGQGRATAGGPATGAGFTYEIVRTEAEWRNRLTGEEYRILREGGTEPPETGDLWKLFDDGLYLCRGCDLRLFDAIWKRDVNLGWNFFRHAEPDGVLTGIDREGTAYGQSLGADDSMIEIHCRRCGSHLGHLLRVRRDLLFCINGTALRFQPRPA